MLNTFHFYVAKFIVPYKFKYQIFNGFIHQIIDLVTLIFKLILVNCINQ